MVFGARVSIAFTDSILPSDPETETESLRADMDLEELGGLRIGLNGSES